MKDKQPATPATPEAPQTPQAQTPEVPQTPTGYPQPVILRPEDDPDLQLRMMIQDKRAKKKEAAEKAQKPSAEAPKEEAKETPEPETPRLNDLIAGALKFNRPKRGDNPDEKKPEEKKEDAPAAAAPEKPVEEPAKPIVKKKKDDPEQDTTAKIISDTVASTTAAVSKIFQGQKKDEPQPAADKKAVEDLLKDEDREEFLVAKHLGTINPKYKGAEQIILRNAAKADKYATNWEAENKGKVFDPNDPEHDSFYSALEKPWTDSEFRQAEIDLRANEIYERRSKEDNKKFDEIAEQGARIELKPAVDQAYGNAAGALAKVLGDDVHEIIMKQGFNKLEEADPIVADALTITLGPLHPIIETIIQVDDPKRRIKLDANNPLHQQWSQILTEGEAVCAGKKDDKGRLFATRADYVKMSKAQQDRHWYLTSDHMIAGVIDYAGKEMKAYVETEKEKTKKRAIALGFVPKESGAPVVTNDLEEKKRKETPAPAPVKPSSPSTGGDSKPDAPGSSVKSANGKIIENFANVLFRKG